MRALAWTDAVGLVEAFGGTIALRACREDAFLLVLGDALRIVVSERVDRRMWGVFCVVHELGHWLLHPGTREYYLRSPGWLAKTESQANVVALLALWPRPAPYPRVLGVEEARGLVHLRVTFTSSRAAGPAPRWRSRTLTMPRYRDDDAVPPVP
jgi:hypothetical protein